MMSRTLTKHIFGKVFLISLVEFERHLLVAARLQGPALPFDHLAKTIIAHCSSSTMLIIFIIAVLVCFEYLIPWQEVAHNICHAPFLHFFDDSAIAAMVHHLRGNRLLPKDARLSEQTTNNHPDVQCSQYNAMQSSDETDLLAHLPTDNLEAKQSCRGSGQRVFPVHIQPQKQLNDFE